MGAFDSIEADAPCPQCGDIYYFSGSQTKFFEPDYDDQRWMRPGEWHPLAAMPDRQGSEWVQVRDPVDVERFTLLVDLDDMFTCACDCPCAPLYHFVLRPGQIMLERVEILDARADIASRVDFADGEGAVPWNGAWNTYEPLLRAFEQRPFAERAQALHAAIAKRFDYEIDTFEPWTTLVGPTRCEACGDARERMHHTLLSHADPTVGSLFGPAWPGGAILIGERVPFDEAQASGRARRLRTPGDTITVAGIRNWFGCRCGAGRTRYVARFERRDGALVLVDLALRATDDTSDVDYLEH